MTDEQTTYRIPAVNYPRLEAEIVKLNKRGHSEFLCGFNHLLELTTVERGGYQENRVCSGTMRSVPSAEPSC